MLTHAAMPAALSDLYRIGDNRPIQSLMTELGVIEGEILSWLESEGEVSTRCLVRQMPWPSRHVMMAIGALIRQGLARGFERELDITVQLIK